MSALRKDLENLLMINPVLAIFLQAGVGLIFIYPVLNLIEAITYVRAIYAIMPFAYVIYVISILACVAKEYDWAIGSVLSIQMLSYLINLIKCFTVGNLFYVLLYLTAAILVFIFFAKSKGVEFNFNRNAGQMQGMNPTHCPQCGALVEPGGKFCQSCGSPLNYGSYGPAGNNYGNGAMSRGEVNYGVNYGGVGPVEYSGTPGMIAQICSSIPVLVFAILFSVNILTKLIANHGLVGILSIIPMIIMCIGVWLAYAGFARGNNSTTGLSLINGCLIFNIVVCLIYPAIIIVVALITWIGVGSDAAGLCLLLIFGSLIFACLLFLYWNGLRKTTTSAKKIILGQNVPWTTSMYCVVLMILGVAFKFIALMAVLVIRGSIETYLNGLLYSYGYGMGSSVYNGISSGISSIFRGYFSAFGIINSIIGIGVAVCAVIILLQIRKRANQQSVQQYY